MKHKNYSLGVILAGLPWNLSHYQALLHVQIILEVGHLMPKGGMKAVGEYAGDWLVLLLHGGIFEVEIWGELLGVMGYMLQINQFIHFIFFQLRIVDYLTVFYVGDRII